MPRRLELTTEALRALLPEFALGTLSEDEVAAVEAHLAAHPEDWARVDAATEALASLVETLPPVAPRHAARTRLLKAAEARPRAEGLVDRVARFLDLGAQAARQVLTLLDDAAAWVAAPLPGVWLCDLEGGPATAGARVGYVRLSPGVTFPHHEHFGHEATLIVQGGWRDDAGGLARRGDVIDLGPGSHHDFTALDGPDLIFLVVLRGGISLPGFE